MEQLTDLELCKRIAEIECYVFDTGGKYFRCEITEHGKVVGYINYNPLTDDALCFQLLKKYNIDLISPYLPNNDTKYEAQIFINGIADVLSEYDDNANKAILLAIVAAHNG